MPAGKLIYLSLGTNLGDRARNLDRALVALAEVDVEVLRRSSLYATEPVDFKDQPWFLNCVVEARTPLLPRQLLHGLQQAERAMGRLRLVARGPRIIDIDILLYEKSVIRTSELEVPHPRMLERRFVLVPLAELAPELRHPVVGATITELLATTSDTSGVRVWTTDHSQD